MQKHTIVGIDVSSATLDICIKKDGKLQSLVIENQEAAIKRFLKTYKTEQLIVGMENTGRYNWALYQVLAGLNHTVFVISPVHLKKSMGLVRGKNDRIDAVRIASFIEKNQADLVAWQPTKPLIQKLKILLTERNSRIKTKRQLLKQQTDYPKMKVFGLDKSLLKMNQEMAAQVDKQIRHLEQQIELLIESDPDMKEKAVLMRSVPGVGKMLCWTMLAKTENFTSIQDPRKMACYSGVVPFDHQSGTSIMGRKRVSHYADKAIKTILHMAAMSAIRLNNDLRTYYLRKVAEGKNKMSILNAVRNKIIQRVFAVVKNQTPYKNIMIVS